MERLVVCCALFTRVAPADVDVYEYDDAEYEAPMVEESSLERHETRTHDVASGVQYNFVERAAQETNAGKGSTDGQSLFEMLAGGAEVEVINLEDGSAPSRLQDMLKQMLSLSSSSAAKPKPAPQKLPSVPPDTPLSDVLQTIRHSMHSREATSIGASAASEEDEDEEDEEEEDDDDDHHHQGQDQDGEADAVGSGDAYIDHLDAHGLKLLEAELLRKLRRVRQAKQRQSYSERMTAGASGKQPSESSKGSRLFDVAEAAATTGEAVGLGVGKTLSEALADALGVKPSAVITLGGDGAAASARKTATAAANADEEEGVESYATRLANEAQQREGGAADGGDGDDDDEGSDGTPTTLHAMLQQMIGGGDGQPIKFEVILGGDGQVGGGRGGLTSLFEQLTSQLGSSDQDDGDVEEEDT